MTYNAGIIGTGGVAGMGILGMHDEETIGNRRIEASHAGGYAGTDELELTAIADVDEEQLTTFGGLWDVPPDGQYLDHEAMLNAEDFDVVSVCTPSFLHAQHVIDAARSAANPGVIWCEKPIASQISAAERMVDVCDETDTELVINHSFRFTDKLQQLHHLIRDRNLLGDIRSVSMQYRMELMRNSTHLLDTLVYLLDARAERVSGYINGENEAADALEASEDIVDAGGGGHLLMDDGTFVTVDCTIPRDLSSMMLNFVGTEGKLYMNNDDGEWRYWSLKNGEHVERPLPGIEGSWTWDDDYEQSFTNAAGHVRDLLSGGVTNHSPGTEAIKSFEVIAAFYLSHYTGGTVQLPMEQPLREMSITSW